MRRAATTRFYKAEVDRRVSSFRSTEEVMSRILGLLKMSPLRSHAGARFLRFLLSHLKKKKKRKEKRMTCLLHVKEFHFLFKLKPPWTISQWNDWVRRLSRMWFGGYFKIRQRCEVAHSCLFIHRQQFLKMKPFTDLHSAEMCITEGFHSANNKTVAYFFGIWWHLNFVHI